MSKSNSLYKPDEYSLAARSLARHFGRPDAKVDRWADELRKLCDEHGVSLQQIKTTVRWYLTEGRHSLYLPKVRSAAGLRKRWLEISLAREAYGHRDGLASLIFDELGRPAVEGVDLLVAIQASLNAYRAYLAELERLRDDGLVGYLLSVGSDPTPTVLAWTLWRLKNPPPFFPELRNYVMDVRGKWFRRRVAEWVSQYSGRRVIPSELRRIVGGAGRS